MFGTTEALSNQHNLTYELCVRHHHGTGSIAGDKKIEFHAELKNTVKIVSVSHLKRALRFSGSSVLPA